LTAQGNAIYYLNPAYGDGWLGLVPYDNYDFAGFILETQDGTKYYLNRDDLRSHSPGGDWLVETYGPPYLARIVQRSGDKITISPNLITHTYTNGATSQIVIQRNSDGLIASISDPNGLTSGVPSGPPAVQYQYDSQDNLISVLNLVNPSGGGAYVTNFFNYTNANFPHYVTGIVNADGTQVAKNFYDDTGKLIAVEDANGNLTQFIHNLTNDMDVIVDRRGYTNTYVYDLRGNIIDQTNQLGQVTTMAYDSNNNKTNNTSFLNGQVYATSSYVYDLNLNLMLVSTDPLGHTNSFTYDTNGDLLSSVDARGNPTSNTYDGNGNLIVTVDALMHGTTNFYSGSQMLGSVDAVGTTTTNYYDPSTGYLLATATLGAVSGAILSSNTFTYDANGNRLTSTVWRMSGGDWTPATTTYVYDGMNRVVQTIDPDDGTNIVVYNNIGKQQATIDPLGNTSSYAYDDQGRLIVTTYPDLTTGTSIFVTAFGYDGAGRLIWVSNALNQVTSYEYDTAGNEVAQIDALNRTNSFVYDGMGRRIAHTMPGGQTEGFVYDLAGNQIYRTNFNGAVIADQYDTLNRLTNRTSINGYQVTYSYSATGQRTNMTDASGTTSYNYDNRDRLISKTLDNPVNNYTILHYLYDANGNLTSLLSTYSVSGDYAFYGGVTNVYQYDALNRLTNVLAGGGKAASYSFDLAGNLRAMSYGNGVTNVCQYDPLNRLTNEVWKLNTGTLGTFYYQLGASGNRTNLNEMVAGFTRTNAWSYDSLYRLANETIRTNGGSSHLGYTYDAVGNRTARTVAGSNLSLTNQIFTFNTNDWLNTDQYDSDGNTTNASGNYYQYDAMDHLVAMGNQTNFVYDGDGNRVSKTVDGVTTYYLVDDRNPSGYPQVVEVWNDSDHSLKVYNYGLALISQQQVTNVCYYGFDGHGSVRFLTDTNGTVTDTYAYDAYGTLIASSGSTANSYLYCGQQLDPDLGLYYNRARYLNPNTGRFWTSDTFTGNNEDPLSLHKYLYTQDDPVDGSDPSGNFDVDIDLDIGGMLDSFSLGGLGPLAENLANSVAGKFVDVYVWDRQASSGSVGHVMSTEHNSTKVINNQFPFKKKTGGVEGTYRPGGGYNRTILYSDALKDEGRIPDHQYKVLVPDPSDFYNVAAQQRAATYWNWDPTTPNETQCSTAVFLSLRAGKVNFGSEAKYTSGLLWPNTFDGWMTEDSRNSAVTGITSVK